MKLNSARILSTKQIIMVHVSQCIVVIRFYHRARNAYRQKSAYKSVPFIGYCHMHNGGFYLEKEKISKVTVKVFSPSKFLPPGEHNGTLTTYPFVASLQRSYHICILYIIYINTKFVCLYLPTFGVHRCRRRA